MPDRDLPSVTTSLHEVAHGRSGDKGNRCNVSVIGYTAEVYPWLVRAVTPAAVGELLAHRGAGRIVRHELPQLWALNLVIDEVLEGGVNASLGLDGHGKALSFLVLSMPITLPRRVVEDARRARLG